MADIFNIVFAPNKMTEITNSKDILSWKQARQKIMLYYSKPFLLGNPKNMTKPIPYPKDKQSAEENKMISNIICLWLGDITKISIECIVNSANIKLKYGGGVCGAIHRASGQELQKQCLLKYPNGCLVTECAITDGFKLNANKVIHAVGPAKLDTHNDEINLSKTYKNALKLSMENNIRSVCFCCIGCGTHSLPLKPATKIAVYSVIKYLMTPIKTHKLDDTEQKNHDDDDNNEEAKDVKYEYQYFDKIVFNCFREDELEVYKYWLTEKLG